jgi:CheY-like chemotaxis protein
MPVKVLYIEDNPQNMRLVRKMLNTIGYDMIEALDGQTGVLQIEREHPDIVLVDINLPDIDGLEVLRRIRANDAYRHLPMIALTANAMFGDRQRFLDAGFDGYLAKPISRRELTDSIVQYLGGQS